MKLNTVEKLLMNNPARAALQRHYEGMPLRRLEAGSVVGILHLGWWLRFTLADVWIGAGAVLLALPELRAESRGRGRHA